MAEIAEEYEYRRDQFAARAREFTRKYASQEEEEDKEK